MAFQMTLGEANEALSRAKNAMGRVREKAEEAIGSGIEVAEVGGTVDHFVQQYAPKGVGVDLSGALAGAVGHLPNVFAALPPGVPQGLGHVFGPLHGPHPGAPRMPPRAAPLRLPPSPRMVQPLRTALA